MTQSSEEIRKFINSLKYYFKIDDEFVDNIETNSEIKYIYKNPETKVKTYKEGTFVSFLKDRNLIALKKNNYTWMINLNNIIQLYYRPAYNALSIDDKNFMWHLFLTYKKKKQKHNSKNNELRRKKR
tara:strand:+ start:133 stop:513 length:381 start_codon:yes stop_codon:yes gene_type:complete